MPSCSLFHIRGLFQFDGRPTLSISEQLGQLNQCDRLLEAYHQAWIRCGRPPSTFVVPSLSTSISCLVQWKKYRLDPGLVDRMAVLSAADLAVTNMIDAAGSDKFMLWFVPVYDCFFAVGAILEEASIFGALRACIVIAWN
jgi:hypothetical protein